MEELKFNNLGQWDLTKADFPQKGRPWTDVHFSDGSRKSFPYKYQATSHLASQDYHPDGESKDGVQHFSHISDPSRTAKVVFHQKYDPKKSNK